MAQQTDIIPGIDFSGNDEVSKGEIIQAIEQAEPLDNIAFVIVDDDEPDVANNPRFERYLWVDNSDPSAPLLNYYNTGTNLWTPFPVTIDSVVSASIVDGAVTYNTKIGGFAAAAADALKLLRVNAAGTRVEVVTFGSALLPTIILSKLTTAGGGANYFLKWNNAGTALVYEAFDGSLINANTIPLTKLVNGTAGQLGFISRANPATGVIELASNLDRVSDLFGDNSIKISRLYDVAAQNGDIIQYNGANWVRVAAKKFFGVASTANPPAAAAGGQRLAAHGLAAIPKDIQGFLKCTTNDLGFTAANGDLIPLAHLIGFNGVAELTHPVTVHADATNVYAEFRNYGAGGEYQLIDTSFNRTAITVGRWAVYFYASLD